MAARPMETGWTREKILGRIRLLRESGEDLSYSRVSRRHAALLAAANYHFGSWRNAVEKAGFDYANDIRKIPRWTNEKIIRAIRAAHERGVDLSWTNVTRDKELSPVAYAAIRKGRFANWDSALRAAGVDPSEVRRYESWSPGKIIARIKHRAGAGEPLNSKAMQEEAPKLFSAALSYFGSWQSALRAAGLDPQQFYRRRRWTRELIKNEIQALHRSGESMAASNIRKKYTALYSAACKHFGGWTVARQECGIKKGGLEGRR